MPLRRHLAPGGYFEHGEVSPVLSCDDGSIPPGSLWETQGQLAVECGELFGKTMLVQPRMKDWAVEAGFSDVKEHTFKWPLGPWSNDRRLKDIGRWNMHSWNTGLEGWTMALLTRYKGVSYFSACLRFFIVITIFFFPYSSSSSSPFTSSPLSLG